MQCKYRYCWHLFWGVVAVLAALLSVAHGITSPTDNVVLDWNNAALAAIRGSRLGPPISARALAILHTCMYDAWASYDEKAIGTEYRAKVPSDARSPENKRKSVSFAAYTALL